jgi:hypothetical protein
MTTRLINQKYSVGISRIVAANSSTHMTYLDSVVDLMK